MGFLTGALPSMLWRRDRLKLLAAPRTSPPSRTLISVDARRRLWRRQAAWMKHAAQVRQWCE